MKSARSLIGLLLGAVLLVFLLRVCAFTVLTIPGNGEAPVLQQGDRILVNKWAYGLRRPLSQWGGYLRYCPQRAERGDWMAFNNPAVEPGALPDTSRLCVGCVMAGPGDTIWMGQQGRISPVRDFRRGCIWPVVVPARGTHVRVTPWTAPLYALTIQRHEGMDVSVVRDSISVGDQLIGYFRFQHDYYWTSSGNDSNLFDSRTFGFVPTEFVVGKATAILYSFDPQKPWLKRWRRKRTMRAVKSL
jgi:signal peptidase I